MKPAAGSNSSHHQVSQSDENWILVTSDEPAKKSELNDVVNQDILLALTGLQFGEVIITVREGRVVQIERIARRRQTLSKKID